MFETLFKFDTINFIEGSIRLDGGGFAIGAAVLLLIMAGILVLVYRTTDRFASRRDRGISAGLRTAALALLAFPLLEPVLVMPDVVPDENFVAIVLDASSSMSVPDGPRGVTRWEQARRLAVDDAGSLSSRLEEHFKLRYYAFGETSRRVDSVASVSADGNGTDLTGALEQVLTDFRGLPLAGVILLTDGAENEGGVPMNAAEQFRAAGIPLHIVGFGEESAERDRELLEAVVHRGIERTTGAEIEIKLRSWRDEPEPVAVDLYQGENLVHSTRYPLKGNGLLDQVTLYYEPKATDPLEYTLRLQRAQDETNLANNELRVLIDPRQDTLRVLYIEGHPRRDFKFIKRALDDDEAVHFTSILRTGTGKIYRQGINHPDELAGGFPTTAEELYRYKAVLLGDVEASHFSIEQLELLERFVRLRGGGFAMLGGGSSFAEGNYWDTPLADVLPVYIDPSRREVIPASFAMEDADPVDQGFRFTPTAAGLENPILRLSVDPDENRMRWGEMPGLTSINYLGAVKPGGVVLAEKLDDQFGASEPVLIVQRYGKGRGAALATASTWRWQMLMDAEDQRHERFWRQFIRWLAASAPGQLNVDVTPTRTSPDQEVGVRISVFNKAYQPQSDADVQVVLRDPSGQSRELPIRSELGSAGVFAASIVPDSEGVYTLDITADTPAGPIGHEVKSFLVRESGREFQDAVLKRAFLQDLAEDADGFYYDAGETGSIDENLRGRRTSTSIYRAEYLWDTPLIFLLALGLLAGEWFWRRRRGLP